MLMVFVDDDAVLEFDGGVYDTDSVVSSLANGEISASVA